MMKIDIFWHYQNQIIGITHDFNLSDQDSLGLIDSAMFMLNIGKSLEIK